MHATFVDAENELSEIGREVVRPRASLARFRQTSADRGRPSCLGGGEAVDTFDAIRAEIRTFFEGLTP